MQMETMYRAGGLATLLFTSVRNRPPEHCGEGWASIDGNNVRGGRSGHIVIHICQKPALPSIVARGGHREHHSPSTLLLQLGAEEQVSEQEDVTQLAGPLHQLHHEAILQQLPVLWARCGQRGKSR